MIKKKFRAEVFSEEAREDIGFGKIEALFQTIVNIFLTQNGEHSIVRFIVFFTPHIYY